MSFPVIAIVLFAFFFAASAPSPMFVVMQHAWGFSPSLLTVAFAVYAIALLASLLVAGSLSDYIGRRPVMLLSMALQTVAMLAFILADGIAGLIAARIVQGVAMGVATGALAAAVVESAPPGKKRLGALISSVSPMAGLAVGALFAGFAIRYVSAPIPWLFGALAALFAIGAAVIAFTPETASTRAGAWASLVPHVFIPVKARPVFLNGLPSLIAGWALGGLYLGLAPTIMLHVFHVDNSVVNGLAIAVLAGVGAIGSTALKRLTHYAGGAVAMASVVAGMALLLAAIATGSIALFFVGSVVAGVGFGAGFSAFLQGIVPTAQMHERAELFAAIFIVCYLAFSIPPMLAGAMVKPFGLTRAVEGYIALLLLVAALGSVVQWLALRKVRLTAT